MDRKFLFLTVILLVMMFTNVFANMLIIQLVANNSDITSRYELLKREGNIGIIKRNRLLAFAVLNYGNSVKTIAYHLDVIWEDAKRTVQIYNYKIPAPLFHLGETIRLLKHCYENAITYASEDNFFKLLVRISCNSSFGNIIRAFNLVYGHIYAFGVRLGEHKIDNTLIVYSQHIFERMSLILCRIEANGVYPEDQLDDEQTKALISLYDQLNSTVTAYLQKPGTIIW